VGTVNYLSLPPQAWSHPPTELYRRDQRKPDAEREQ
jgi:hypothetical protein